MKTFNVTLSNNTSLQVIANSMEEVLEAFKMEVTGIVCDNIEQCTSPNVQMEWINFNNIEHFEIDYDDSFDGLVVDCNTGKVYRLKSFAFRMDYSANQAAELVLFVEKILRSTSVKLVVKTYNENHLSVKVNGMTLLDSCLLRLMEKVLKLVTSQNAL